MIPMKDVFFFVAQWFPLSFCLKNEHHLYTHWNMSLIPRNWSWVAWVVSRWPKRSWWLFDVLKTPATKTNTWSLERLGPKKNLSHEDFPEPTQPFNKNNKKQTHTNQTKSREIISRETKKQHQKTTAQTPPTLQRNLTRNSHHHPWMPKKLVTPPKRKRNATETETQPKRQRNETQRRRHETSPDRGKLWRKRIGSSMMKRRKQVWVISTNYQSHRPPRCNQPGLWLIYGGLGVGLGGWGWGVGLGLVGFLCSSWRTCFGYEHQIPSSTLMKQEEIAVGLAKDVLIGGLKL